MSLTLTQSKTAIGPGLTVSFLAVGGTMPYVFSVVPGGAGGTINSSTGLYTGPAVVNPDPALSYDTIQVTDAASATATGLVLVANALGLVCEIVQNQMGLDNGRVYLWDQKINQPKDNDIYIAISVLRCKPFANTNFFDGSIGHSVQSINMMAQLSIDIISRGPGARDRKEEVLLALASDYSQTQQQGNSFSIGRLPPGGQFINLSNLDGAAIPYRFNISVNIQYFVQKSIPVDYYNDFETVEVTTNP